MSTHDAQQMFRADAFKATRGSNMALAIMRTVFSVLVGLSLSACANTVIDRTCPLEGKWQSNEALTLSDMREHGKLNDKQLSFFSKPGFFGRFIREYSCTHGRGYFAEESPSEAGWAAYRIKKHTESFVILQSDGDERTERLELEGNCFKTPMRNLNFHEYFCRQ